MGDEWVALESFAVQMACAKCGFTLEGEAENFSIDIATGRIMGGFMRTD
jgi:hypothetical protein